MINRVAPNFDLMIRLATLASKKTLHRHLGPGQPIKRAAKRRKRVERPGAQEAVTTLTPESVWWIKAI
jgi:hypothetical protein